MVLQSCHCSPWHWTQCSDKSQDTGKHSHQNQDPEEVSVFSISDQPSHLENGSTGCLRVLVRIKCKDELDVMAYAYNPSTGGMWVLRQGDCKFEVSL